MNLDDSTPPSDNSRLCSYRSGVAQASASRIINREISDYLAKFDLTAMQWFIIGTVHDAGPSGIRLTDLADQIHTSFPYITNVVLLLESRGIAQKTNHETDNRVKFVSITPSYRARIDEIENGLSDYLQNNFFAKSGISLDELRNYTAFLAKITQSF